MTMEHIDENRLLADSAKDIARHSLSVLFKRFTCSIESKQSFLDMSRRHTTLHDSGERFGHSYSMHIESHSASLKVSADNRQTMMHKDKSRINVSALHFKGWGQYSTSRSQHGKLTLLEAVDVKQLQ